MFIITHPAPNGKGCYVKQSGKKDLKAAIYIRVSTLDQAKEGYSLAAQRKALDEWCHAKGYEISEIYEDAGISAKDIAHRPAMCKLLQDVDGEKFDMVLVWALSRLTRSVADLYNTWARLQAHDVGLISYTEAFDTSTPTGRAMMGLLGVFAQMEREITAERVRAAMIERATQGKRTCNDVLGYDLKGSDGLAINEAEAQRVRYIFNRYLEYKSLSAVAELCELRGYTGKRGGRFRAQHIKTILSRPIYIGYNSFCGELYRGNFEPIISEPQFNRVQKLLYKKPK